jgi:hypothetical protein
MNAMFYNIEIKHLFERNVSKRSRIYKIIGRLCPILTSQLNIVNNYSRIQSSLPVINYLR